MFHLKFWQKTVPAAIKPFLRTAWKPQVTDGDASPKDSKFSGIAWLAKDESWPVCQNCGQPMPLFLQLNLERLPDALHSEFGNGLLQLFYCINSEPHCESECEVFFPFTQGKLVRIIEPEGEFHSIEMPEIGHYFPPKRITGWEEMEDYPNWEEGQEHGITLSDHQWDTLAKRDFPHAGDKLAGWPCWIQKVEYPNCPICNTRMQLVFQLDSNDHLPYMFGDLGCGHITQCPTHKAQLAFAWACS